MNVAPHRIPLGPPPSSGGKPGVFGEDCLSAQRDNKAQCAAVAA